MSEKIEDYVSPIIKTLRRVLACSIIAWVIGFYMMLYGAAYTFGAVQLYGAMVLTFAMAGIAIVAMFGICEGHKDE